MMKLGMALATAVETKTQGVREYGIGEDINQVLYGWRQDRLTVVSRMTDAMQRQSAEYRFLAVSEATAMMRQGWGADEITMVAEGYVSDEPRATEGKNFAREFARGNDRIKEAITITHVLGKEVSFVTKPYKYAVPKSVVWDEENFVPGRQRVIGNEGMYPLLFSKALELPLGEGVENGRDAGSAFYDALALALVERGFETKSFV
jgi:hypothetical protein